MNAACAGMGVTQTQSDRFCANSPRDVSSADSAPVSRLHVPPRALRPQQVARWRRNREIACLGAIRAITRAPARAPTPHVHRAAAGWRGMARIALVTAIAAVVCNAVDGRGHRHWRGASHHAPLRDWSAVDAVIDAAIANQVFPGAAAAVIDPNGTVAYVASEADARGGGGERGGGGSCGGRLRTWAGMLAGIIAGPPRPRIAHLLPARRMPTECPMLPSPFGLPHPPPPPNSVRHVHVRRAHAHWQQQPVRAAHHAVGHGVGDQDPR
jgi:hypothetical protein